MKRLKVSWYLIIAIIALGIGILFYWQIAKKPPPFSQQFTQIETSLPIFKDKTDWQTIILEKTAGGPAIRGEEQIKKIQISKEGKLIYEDLAQKEKRESTLSAQELAEINALIDKAAPFSLKNDYQVEAVDWGVATFTINHDSQSKTITIHGLGNYPQVSPNFKLLIEKLFSIAE